TGIQRSTNFPTNCACASTTPLSPSASAIRTMPSKPLPLLEQARIKPQVSPPGERFVLKRPSELGLFLFPLGMFFVGLAMLLPVLFLFGRLLFPDWLFHGLLAGRLLLRL